MKGRSKAGGKSEKRRDRKTAKPKPKQSSGSHAHVRRTSSGIRIADVQQLIQERDAALDQQAATSEILEVISRSTGDLQPIFAAILQNAVRLCDASFGDIYSWERGALHLLASYNSPPAFAEERRRSEGIPPSPDSPTTSGRHLWAERYDRDLTDLFAVQDDVTCRIVAALRVTLSPAETLRLADSSSCNIEAYDFYLRGRVFLWGENKNRETFEQSVILLKAAVELDHNYSQAYAGLAWAYIFDYFNRWSDNRDSSLEVAENYAETAVQKDPNEPIARCILALAAMLGRDLDRARSEVGVALALNPNFAFGYNTLASIYTYSSDRHDRARYAAGPSLGSAISPLSWYRTHSCGQL